MEITRKLRSFYRSNLGSILNDDIMNGIEEILTEEYDLYREYYLTMSDLVGCYDIPNFAIYITEHPDILNTYDFTRLRPSIHYSIAAIAYLRGDNYSSLIDEEEYDDILSFIDDYRDDIDYSYQNTNLDRYREMYGDQEADIMGALIKIAEEEYGPI